MIKKRNRGYVLLLIVMLLAAMLTGTGAVSAADDPDSTYDIPVVYIDSENFQQLGSVSIAADDAAAFPDAGETITIRLPAGCQFDGMIGDDALKSGLLIEYTNVREVSSEKISDNEVRLLISGAPGADRQGNSGSIVIHFAAVKVTEGSGNIEAAILSSGTVVPEVTTAVIAVVRDGSGTTFPEGEEYSGGDPGNGASGGNTEDADNDSDTSGGTGEGTDPENGDTSGGETPGDEIPGDEIPGDQSPGDETPGNNDPDDLLPPDSDNDPGRSEDVLYKDADAEQSEGSYLIQMQEKKAALSDAEKKLDTRLLQLINEEFLPPGKSRLEVMKEMQKHGQLSAGSFITRSEEKSLSARVKVYINLIPGTDFTILDPYVSEIINSSSEFALAAAWVEIRELENLAGLNAVKSIHIVVPPVHNSGFLTSEGDAVHRADLFRSQTGKDGTGIKIGIISDGVDHYASAQASGDLPANLHVLSNSIGGDEGTAMLEIVHDLAPGAELYFHDLGGDWLSFNDAVTELAEAGCKVICDDIGWLTQPFFEDGIVAQHIASVIEENDIIYASSAGNAAMKHYQGMYHNDGSNFHSDTLYVNIPAGGTVLAVLQWNDSISGSYNDYDFVLRDAVTYEQLAISYLPQNGSQEPGELIQYTNETGYELDGELLVQNFMGQASAKILEIFVYCYDGASLYNNNITPEDSIFGHPAVPDVIACGAVRASTPGTIESFSSRGPVTMLTGTRQKPDIVGADGVAVTGAGGFPNPFYGTSAAAPHVAAIAALGWSQDLTQTADQVRNKIMNGAVDLGSSGYDNVFGYGRADVINSFPAPTINVKGYARYKNSAGDHSGITVTAKAGTSVIDTAATDSSGLFEMTLPDGTYTLELTLPGYLKTILTNISVSGSLTEVSTADAPIELSAGDIDGSGLIDLSDLGLLAGAYGANSSQANYLQAADFDRSQLIDLSDLGFLASHYGDSETEEPQPLLIGTSNPPGATQNQFYTGHTFTASGGTAPYSFAITSGSLPAGMSLSTAGYLSGTPTASGTFNFTVRVTDSKSATASRVFTLVVSQQKGWTIMLYSDADNNLEPQLLQDIAEAKAGITNDVNMVVLVDRIAGYSSDSSVLGSDFTDTRLYRITPGTATRIGGGTQFPQITTTSNYEANMGDANTLKKFIQFCKANYPADHYALILSNHGDGARSGSKMIAGTDMSIENGVCADDTSDDILYIAEITDVLGTTESVDLLAFDACLMGTAEVAYQYRPGNGSFAADVMVASAPNVWGYGLDYQAILARLNTTGGNNGQTDSTMGGLELNYDPAALTALQFGGIMVEEQYDSTTGIMNDQSLACYDLSKAGAVKTAFDTLARDLYSKSKRSDFEAVRGSGSNPATIKYFNATDEVEWIVFPYFDIYDLCRRVNSSTTKFDSTTRSSAAAVMTAVDNMIVYSFGGTYYFGFTKGQNGLSVFFPDGARPYSDLGAPMWAYQWWYNSIDTNIWWPPDPDAHLYGKLKWCIDGRYTATSSVGNWFEMLDAWYDSYGNTTSGGCNGYQW